WEKPTPRAARHPPCDTNRKSREGGCSLKGVTDNSSSHDHRSIDFLVWSCFVGGAVSATRAVYLGRSGLIASQLVVIAVQQLQFCTTRPAREHALYRAQEL